MNAPSSVSASGSNVLRDRYELLEVIGRGGASLVCRGIDRMRVLARAPDAEVAVKLVADTAEGGGWARERVHCEAYMLRHLRHPNIVDVIDSDRAGHIHYVVMELLSGRSLAQILAATANHRLALDLVLRIVEGIGSALAHAHRHGILHGDLKPSNVIVTTEGHVKLIDFGAARMIEVPDGAAELRREPDAESFEQVTPLYASLEMLRGEPTDERHDVFAVAVLTYVALTGRHPFAGHSALEASRLGLRPARPPGLSAGRWRGLAQGLALPPEQRSRTIETYMQGFCTPRWFDRLLA